MDGVGRRVASKTTGMPFVMPPLIPPAWLVLVITFPSSTAKGSLAWLPRIREKATPAPKATLFTAGTAKRYCEKIPSTLQPKSGPPSPALRPVTAHSTAPPTESCACFASRMACCICLPAASSSTGKSFSATPRSWPASSSAASQIP